MVFIALTYSAISAIVAFGVTQMGGASALASLPSAVILVLGPMITLGVGHGIEFYVLSTILFLAALITYANTDRLWMWLVPSGFFVGVWVKLGLTLAA